MIEMGPWENDKAGCVLFLRLNTERMIPHAEQSSEMVIPSLAEDTEGQDGSFLYPGVTSTDSEFSHFLKISI